MTSVETATAIGPVVEPTPRGAEMLAASYWREVEATTRRLVRADAVAGRIGCYTEFNGVRSEPLNDYGPVLAHAQVLCAKHDTCLVDRSDKGSGILRATLE